MLDRDVVNWDLLPVDLTYQKVFGHLIFNQLREKDLDALSVDWMIILVGLVIIFVVFEVWFKVSCFRENSLAQ